MTTTKQIAGAMEKVLDAISATHTALIDAVHGYDVMIEKAEPEILSALKSTRAANKSQAEDLHRFLVGQGRHPSDDGSFMSAVHETVVRTRAFFTDLDEDVLPAVVDGERRIVSSYDDALETLTENRDDIAPANFDAAREILVAQRAEIEKIVAHLQSAHEVLDD